jgi:hypothetical protein
MIHRMKQIIAMSLIKNPNKPGGSEMINETKDEKQE